MSISFQIVSTFCFFEYFLLVLILGSQNGQSQAINSQTPPLFKLVTENRVVQRGSRSPISGGRISYPRHLLNSPVFAQQTFPKDSDLQEIEDKLEVVEKFMEEPKNDCKQPVSTLFEQGDFIGIKVKPYSRQQINYLSYLRLNESDIMFWGGRIALGTTIGLAVPIDMSTTVISKLNELKFRMSVYFYPISMMFNYLKNRSPPLNKATSQMLQETARENNVKFSRRSTYNLAKPSRYPATPHSTVVAIFNILDVDFVLETLDCKLGSFNHELTPEPTLPKESATIYATESSGRGTGATGCHVSYSGPGGRSFKIFTSTPFMGSRDVQWTANKVSVSTIQESKINAALDLDQDNNDNKIIRLMISDISNSGSS